MVATLFRPCSVKGNHVDKVTQPRLDVAHVGVDDPAYAEILHRERAEHRAVQHATPKHIVPTVAGTGDGAEQGAGESVTGPGWIAHRLQWMRRSEEDPVPGEQQRTVFAALDDHHPGPVGKDDAGADGRKRLPENCTASSSFTITQSTRLKSRSRPGRAVSSQSFMVSQAMNSASGTCSSTSSCSSGWMLARKTTFESR